MDGIVGVYSLKDPDLINRLYLATGAGQHRGKASTGMAMANKKDLYVHKGLGRIAEVIDYNMIKIFQDLEPIAAIANIGYTKRRVAEKLNAEPIEIKPRRWSPYRLAVTMDGYVIKDEDLREELEKDYDQKTDNKTVVV